MAKITLRKFHRYISLLIAIQLLLWTISGIYFSFNKIENVPGMKTDYQVIIGYQKSF